MAEAAEPAARPTDPVGRVLFAITRIFAILGGLVLCAMAILTTVSVTGRSFLNAPVTGDFELIGIGTGVCVFAFLPYCHLTKQNVIVDFFLNNAPDRAKSFFDTVGNFIYTVIIAVMTWRMSIGGWDLYKADEMTLIMEIPRWWTFPAAMVCLVLLLAVCLYSFVRSLNETRRGI
jgi:TRAP-type C4-dicarboxylate transport system permease small subunit